MNHKIVNNREKIGRATTSVVRRCAGPIMSELPCAVSDARSSLNYYNKPMRE